MKIRTGFVSNSSSTSFCIYGTCFSDKDEMVDFFGEKIFDEEGSFDYDHLDDLLSKTNLDHFYDYECQYLYVGRNPQTIGDDETGKEFKESTKKALEELQKATNPKEIKCSFIEETINS